MICTEKKDLVFIRLFPGENVHEELENACRKHDVGTAVALSGVGQLRDCKLGYFREKGDYSPETFEKPHELLSLSGNIIGQDEGYLFHLHAVLGNEKKEAVGGHLIDGAVEITAEIVLLRSDARLSIRVEEETGLQGLYMD